ncbi:MAG: SDR family NAD(P)-dependent oxidoreductase [Actinomycetota bacterium]
MVDRLAVVTGGSSGLGLALAEGLNAEDIGVVILARDAARLEDALGHLRAAGVEVRGVPCDVSDQAQVRAAFQDVAASGTLRFLFNVAGVGRFGPVEDLTGTAVDEVLAGNLTGLMLATATALPILRAGGGGTIVSVLSSAALVGRPDEAAYTAAKWGARGFMEALRAAVKGSPVRTLTVYPGGMRTPFWSPQTGRSPDLTTYMDPRDVARQILRVTLDPGAAHVTEMTISRS